MSRPILLNSCARAATADEARYRIDRPIAGRSARIFALDDGAAAVLARVAEQGPWGDARFLAAAGERSRVSEELGDADVAVVVATSYEGALAAPPIAEACDRLGIMAAAVILGSGAEVTDVVSALRPHAPMLLVTDDEGDVTGLLTALRV